MAAFAIGGGIILIELAHEQGLIKIDWNKVTKKFDEVGDKVEEAVTGEGPRWADKVISLVYIHTCLIFSFTTLRMHICFSFISIPQTNTKIYINIIAVYF